VKIQVVIFSVVMSRSVVAG